MHCVVNASITSGHFPASTLTFDADRHISSRALSADWPTEQLCVISIAHPAPLVSATVRCLDVLETFFRHPEVYALPVIGQNDTPVTLIERQSFVEFFSQPYAREVYGKKSILRFIADGFMQRTQAPIIVDAATSLDDVATIIIDKGMQHMVSGFIVTANGRYAGVANGHDLLDAITQRRQAELYYLAHHDQLTGLPNRLLFIDRLTQACRETARNGTHAGLLFIDLDRFKQVNDSLGHSVGDALLRSVSERLQAGSRATDTIARLGGDEFAYLIPDMDHSNIAHIVAQRIIEAMRPPFSIMGHELFMTASIGIALCPDDDRDINSLLAKADTAMYEAKKNGRNGYQQYAPELKIYSPEHMLLETDLRNAIVNREFVLFYQPQIDLASGRTLGVEALIRWQHRQYGLLSPGRFIEIAENTGLIVPLGHWVLREACQQLKAWCDAGIPPLRMAINVSALQFRQANFANTVRTTIEETGVDPHLIELELTESIVMHNANDVLRTLAELKNIGVSLALDDFGTGFSSLSYLRRFPIDLLKIDQSFIRDVANMPVNESIVRAIIALGRSLSLQIIAEGVETEAELTTLRSCQCDAVQGYHFLPPASADDFFSWLSARQQRNTSCGARQTCMS